MFLSLVASLAIYDPNPEHLWNRMYAAVATRTRDGVTYGADISEPYTDPFDDPKALSALTDEFLKTHGEKQASRNLRSALFLSDMWTAFDLAAASREGKSLRRKLARVVERLRMTDVEIAGLPDNYADAVKSGAFAKDFDPAHPETPFLPPDLFDAGGSWVEMQSGPVNAVALDHLQGLGGHSVFRVFIRLPGGRQTSLDYLEAERDTQPNGASIPKQFPAGTMFALVRQMVLIDTLLEPVITHVTQSVQLRVYRTIETPGMTGRFDTSQSPYDFALRRADLLAGRAGGFHAAPAGEAEYRHLVRPMDPKFEMTGLPLLKTCAFCHSGIGVSSVRAFSGASLFTTHPILRAPVEAAINADTQREPTLRYTKSRFEWGLFTGLLD